MQIHRLKILPVYFDAVLSGEKTFEIRYNDDRGFQKGDKITLVKINPVNGLETSDLLHRRISYVTNYKQIEGYVVFGIKED